VSQNQRDITRPSTLRRVVGAALDVSVVALFDVWLVRNGWIDSSAWLTPSETLPWPDSALVAFSQTPTSFLAWIALLWAPVAVWHLLFGIIGVSSPGAVLTGVRWVDEFGWPATRLQRVMRAFGYLLWPLTFFFAMFLPWISREGRGLNEWIAATWPSDVWLRVAPSRSR
jgi:hypothetical protein